MSDNERSKLLIFNQLLICYTYKINLLNI